MASLRAITVRGSFRGHSGHDRHVRAFVRELDGLGVAVQLRDMPLWHPEKLEQELRDTWFDSLRQDTGARLVLQFCMPHQVVPDPNKKTVNYTMFEATRVPASWVNENRKHDMVIVPTSSSYNAWTASGMPQQKLQICPLGVDPQAFSGNAEPMPLIMENREAIGSYRTRFLNISELGPRKNIAGLLRAWIKATTAKDDAVLILKLSAHGRFDSSFSQIVRSVEQELGKCLRDAAPLYVVQEIYSDAGMPRLYATATHYISLSFGEGWDQPMMEAGASGLRLIAPEHSAYTTYLDSSIATMIHSLTVPVQYRGDPATARLFAGAEWWEPDEDQAAAAIRAEIDGRGDPKLSARDRIVTEFTWRKATLRLIEILSEIERAGKKRWWF